VRIAISAWFVDKPTTGSGQYLTHLLAEYGTRHAEHTFLLCLHGHQSIPQWFHQLPSCFEWRVLRTPFDALDRHLAKLWFEQVTFPWACRRWNADLIHVPYWGSPLFAPAPTLVTVHDLIPILLPAYRGGVLGGWYTRLVSLSAQRATTVLTDSAAARSDIIQHLRVPPRRVRAIHLAADAGMQRAVDPRELDRVRLKYDLPARYVLYLAGFDVRKNVPNLLRAFARLDLPDVQLVVGGRLPEQDTAFTPDPQRIARELEISNRVHFAGCVDEPDKPALYTAAIALLFPSYYEGFGLPPLEAMSCGTPAITSDRSSLPEVVGKGGLTVDPDDVDALAEAIRQFVLDDELRTRLRQSCLAQASRFSWQRTAEATIAAYRWAAGEH
jgi:glycosyltransferase involved in cell wall biosynthesis